MVVERQALARCRNALKVAYLLAKLSVLGLKLRYLRLESHYLRFKLLRVTRFFVLAHRRPSDKSQSHKSNVAGRAGRPTPEP